MVAKLNISLFLKNNKLSERMWQTFSFVNLFLWEIVLFIVFYVYLLH
ncbi:hypothetical protein X875_5320 [Mannheimia varigena USDA-ARS-USMARC-1388]|nr:hypothetical protein X875_5320 [Mannheimia varigena USDA-ARS-USMARC-1388]